MSVKVNNKDAIQKREYFRKLVESSVLQHRLYATEQMVCYKMRTKFCRGTISSEKKWLVSQFYDGNSSQAADYFHDGKSKFLPWMGLAVDLEDSHPEPTGQIFCVLPLPQHDQSPTGLNFHVNGFFAVSQDRCALN